MNSKTNEDLNSLINDIALSHPEGIWATDKNDRMVFFNQAMEKIAGVKAENVLGKKIPDDFEHKTIEHFINFYLRAKAALEPVEYTAKVITPAGRETMQSGWCIPRIHNDQFDGITCTIKDITELELTKTEIKKQKRKLFAILDKVPGFVYLQARDYTIPFANEGFHKSFGDPTGRLCYEIIHDRGTPCENCPTFKVFETNSPLTWEWTDKTGRTFVIHDEPFPGFGDEESLVLETATEISEQKLVENALRESKHRLALAATSAQLGIWDWDIVNNKMIWDDQMFRLYGISEKPTAYGVEIWKSGLHPNDISYAWEACQAAINGDKKYDIQFRVKHPDGSVKFIKAYGIVLRDENGKAIRMLGVNRDITESRLAEQAIEASEKRYRGLLSNMDVGVVVHRPDTTIAMNNPQAAALLGLTDEQMLGKLALDPHWKFLDRNNNPLPLDEYPVNRVLKSRQPIKNQFLGVVRPLTNDIVWLVVNGFPVMNDAGAIEEILINFIDVTEHTKMENELLKIQKIDALGLLAGGIAHDFNNLMGGIFAYIDMAREESNESKVTSYLEKAMKTMERARALTQQLLTFAKGGAPVQEIGSLIPFIRETAQFALSGASISCDVVIQEDLWACNFDRNQICQALDNILINAKQAMSDGGSIELSARNVTLAEMEHSTLTSGNYVKISIKDCGVGIPKEILPRIFDPFYSTKAAGHGLGLATCYSIIRRHGGCIEVESMPGKGSTFHVYLPAIKDSVSSLTESSTEKHKGNGTILVMDDEEIIQNTFQEMFKILGYTVVCRKDGKEAIEFVSSEIKAGREIAGMVFDLTIPGGMGGKEAIAEIRNLGLKTPAFVTSGYAEDPIMANPEEYGFTASICKPFRMAELSKMLNKHLKQKKL
ncbi:MAG: PAS domain-containing hybrid sensor histidine kinase/response regulator [Candidatus Rifleibacteriota bacterium]